MTKKSKKVSPATAGETPKEKRRKSSSSDARSKERRPRLGRTPHRKPSRKLPRGKTSVVSKKKAKKHGPVSKKGVGRVPKVRARKHHDNRVRKAKKRKSVRAQDGRQRKALHPAVPVRRRKASSPKSKPRPEPKSKAKSRKKAKPRGLTPVSARRPKLVPLRKLSKLQRKLEKERRRHYERGRRVANQIKELERRNTLRKKFKTENSLRLIAEKAREFLKLMKEHAQVSGHKRFRQYEAFNADRTADFQLEIYDWPENIGYDDFWYDSPTMTFVRIPGLKWRVQVRIKVTPKGSSKRFIYLPAISGNRIIYFNYRELTDGILSVRVPEKMNQILQEGWRTVSVAIDVRFDPRWARER